MSTCEFKNNARSTVADSPLAVGATTLNVATGEGANFPSLFPFKLTIFDDSSYPDAGLEIVKCTGRTNDALTIVRAQEGTADSEHANGERVAMLITAGHFNDAATGIVTKLDTIETSAEVNNISDVNANDLTDAGDSTLHYHANDRARANHTGTQAANTISDFDTEVSNNTDVAANTAKNTNATHTGDVTGSEALTLDKTAITNKGIVTAIGSDHVIIADASDAGNLKKALISDFASAGGDMAASTYDPTTVAGDTFDMDNMVESATDKILTSTERSEIAANTSKNSYPSADATKLGTIEENANDYTHPTGDGNKHVPANSTTNDSKVLTAGAAAGVYTWETNPAGFADPMTTRGDIIIKNASNVTARLGIGTNGQVLKSDGSDIAWAAESGGGSSTEKIGFPCEAMYLPATNPATLTEEVGSGAYAGQSHADFDDSTAEHIVARSPGAIDYDGGNMVITMTAKPTTTPSGNVTLIFHIYAVGIADSEAYDTATPTDTGVDITFNFTTATLQSDMMKATATIDPSNVVNGDKLVIELIRDVATDTLVGDGEMIDFDIVYNRVVI